MVANMAYFKWRVVSETQAARKKNRDNAVLCYCRTKKAATAVAGNGRTAELNPHYKGKEARRWSA